MAPSAFTMPPAHLAGLDVLGHHVDVVDDDLALLGGDLKNLALLALVLAGQNDDCIALFDVKLIHF